MSCRRPELRSLPSALCCRCATCCSHCGMGNRPAQTPGGPRGWSGKRRRRLPPRTSRPRRSSSAILTNTTWKRRKRTPNLPLKQETGCEPTGLIPNDIPARDGPLFQQAPENPLLTAQEREVLEHSFFGRRLLEEQYRDLEQQHDTAAFGMWVFLATEVMFFGPLFLSVGVYCYLYGEAFEKASTKLNWMIGGVNTVVL